MPDTDMTPARLAARLVWLQRERERLLREFDRKYAVKGPNTPASTPGQS